MLCHLALTSAAAQHLLGEQFETLHEAARWLEGIPLLEAILAAAPDPMSSAAVNAFLGGLPECDRLALTREVVLEGAPAGWHAGRRTRAGAAFRHRPAAP